MARISVTPFQMQNAQIYFDFFLFLLKFPAMSFLSYSLHILD